MQVVGGSLVTSAGPREQVLCPLGWMLHAYPPQQVPASVLSQRSPGARQPAVRQRPLRQARPSQQPSLPEHVSNSRLHAQVPVVPPSGRTHWAPPQQSVLPVHTSLRRRHAQVPVVCPEGMVQSIWPQHSMALVHEPIAGWQQNVPAGSCPQE
jgi:hypothetical protein